MRNFKGFKKIDDTGSHAVFKHENGSELKVAKAGLSPKMRKQLDSLPVFRAEGDPDGNQVPQSLRANDDSDQSQSPGHPINININAGPPQPQQQPAPPPQQPAMNPYAAAVSPADKEMLAKSVAPKPDAGEQAMQAAQMGPTEQKLAGMPPQPEMPTTDGGLVAQNGPGGMPTPPPKLDDTGHGWFPDPGKDGPGFYGTHPRNASADATGAGAAASMGSPQGKYQQVMSQLLDDSQKVMQDYGNGHITPTTYHDLFAKKDTLGKIGTMFGLLLSGMGSGLTGQPNMVMEMMNKEIHNDLEAQKSSKEGQRNFLNLSHQMLLGQSQAKHLDMETAMQARTLANMNANAAALHHLVTLTQKYPVGSPERAKAEQMLMMLHNGVQNENYRLADRAATGAAWMQGMMGDQNSQMDPATQIRRKQVMGMVSPEQSKEALKEIGQTQNHNQLNQNAFDSFDKVAHFSTLGNRITNPIQYNRQIDAEWNPMMDKLTKDTDGRVTPITVDMMSALKPSMTDNKETLKLKREKLGAILHAGFATPTLDSLGVRVEKGEFSNPRGQTQVAAKDEVRYDAQGNAYRKGPDGRPVRVNQTAAK